MRMKSMREAFMGIESNGSNQDAEQKAIAGPKGENAALEGTRDLFEKDGAGDARDAQNVEGDAAKEESAAPTSEKSAPAAAEEVVANIRPVKKHSKRDFSYTQNRELSWLQFNKRVLEEALDDTVPLFERMKFVAIFDSNLDEFFMVRVGSLTDIMLIDPDGRDNKSNMTAAEQVDAVLASARELIQLRDKVYKKVQEELEAYDIVELDLEQLSKKERKFARDYYREFLLPVLSPQVIDARHPFPHLQNKALYIAMKLTDENGETLMGIVPLPEKAPEVIADPDHPGHFVRTADIIIHNLGKLFGIYKVSSPVVLSVRRNADISFDEEKFDDDESDYRMHVSKLLKKRNRLNPVCLEVRGELDKEVRGVLLERLELNKNQILTYSAPIAIQGVFGMERSLDPALKAQLCYPPFTPRQSKVFDYERSLLDQIAERDRVLFYPYDSMDAFLAVLQEAAHDPAVTSIKITIYRLASESRVAQRLIEAAENGKEVTVLMELRARFDEANNIEWSERLEESGCTIVYGLENFKCHSKICLITKQVDGKTTNYTQIGTGNYNEKTARLYTDLCLFTANETIGKDAVSFFQNMLIGNLNGAYTGLLVAPANMKQTLLALIDREIAKGPAGRITIKANSVTERDIMDRLSEASNAGVQIRMNIRGICCLLPGVPKRTENIHVRSIVGQFLEHSRIYCFGTDGDMDMYISSADLMTRNLVHRVEVACPIYDKDIKSWINAYLDKIFQDNTKARSIQPDGTYTFVREGWDAAELDIPEAPFCLHNWCIEHPLQDESIYEKKEPVQQDERKDSKLPPVGQRNVWQRIKAVFLGD